MNKIKNNVVVEYNDEGYLLYSDSFPGAYTRGKEREEALSKLSDEIKRYCKWAGIEYSETDIVENNIIQSKKSQLKLILM